MQTLRGAGDFTLSLGNIKRGMGRYSGWHVPRLALVSRMLTPVLTDLNLAFYGRIWW